MNHFVDVLPPVHYLFIYLFTNLLSSVQYKAFELKPKNNNLSTIMIMFYRCEIC